MAMTTLVTTRACAALAGLLGLAASFPAQADSLWLEPRAVVELFTSQGCAQCPPADQLLSSLSDTGNVVALAYHVDYWDYVGWPDTFGNEANSDRQRAYARSWGDSRIFTPQMVINGQYGVIGSRQDEVNGALASASLPLPVEASIDDDMLRVAVPADRSQADAVVWLVTFIDEARVEIERGENAGKSMIYSQVVTGRRALGMWEGSAGAVFTLPIQEVLSGANDGFAILVQHEENGMPGPILGAAAFER
jgi:hypothetical protein